MNDKAAVTLVKTSDEYRGKAGAKKKDKKPVSHFNYLNQTLFINIPYPSTGHNTGYMWLFLAFRSLCLSDKYHAYVRAISYSGKLINKNNQKLKETNAEFPLINEIYQVFGDISSYASLDSSEGFNLWLNESGVKIPFCRFNNLKLISSDDEFKSPINDCIYFKVPKQFDDFIDEHTQEKILKSISKVLEEAITPKINYSFFDLLGRKASKEMYATEMRLDICFLRKYYGLSAAECVTQINSSDKECWKKFKDDFSSRSDEKSWAFIDRKLTEGWGLIKNTTNNNFPKLKE